MCSLFSILNDLDPERLTALCVLQSNKGVGLMNLSTEFTNSIKSSPQIECHFIYFSSFKSQFEILVKYSETFYCWGVQINFVYSERFARFFAENNILCAANTQHSIGLISLLNLSNARNIGCHVLNPELGSITTHLIKPSDRVMIDEIVNLTQYFAKK